MESDSTEVSITGKNTLSMREGKDGIKEQILLLNQLSVKLDEYFALHTFGPGNGRTG